MSNQYLWDRTGEPDPDVVQLESRLGKLRYEHKAPSSPRRKVRLPRWGLPLAAAIAGLAIGTGWLTRQNTAPAWQVSTLAGTPSVDQQPLRSAQLFSTGVWLETDGRSQARIQAANIGLVDVNPGSRVQLSTSRHDEHRLRLAKGEIEAFITAPPRLFFVETPSALAIDLGCAYRLKVDESGNGLLQVKSGWVELHENKRRVLVPSGAQCLLRNQFGPGTPHFPDATATFQSALIELDFGDKPDSMSVVLAEARPKDSLTLWNLCHRLDETQRKQVYDRVVELIPSSARIKRERIVRLEADALGAWKEILNKHW